MPGSPGISCSGCRFRIACGCARYQLRPCSGLCAACCCFPWYFCPCAGKTPASGLSAPLRLRPVPAAPRPDRAGCRCLVPDRCRVPVVLVHLVSAAAGKTRTITAHGVRNCSSFRPFCSCFFRGCGADRVRPGKNNPNNNEFSPLPVPAAAASRIAAGCLVPGTSCAASVCR